MLLIKFYAGGKFFVPSRIKICLNYVSRHSVRRKYQKFQKIAEITMTVTKHLAYKNNDCVTIQNIATPQNMSPTGTGNPFHDSHRILNLSNRGLTSFDI